MVIKTYFCTLNWNTSDWLMRMVTSVEETVGAPHSWVIVDNGSREGEQGNLKRFLFDSRLEYSVDLLRKNTGCIHGYNRAFDTVDANRDGQAQVIMINTDVTLHETGWLTRVTAWADEHPEVGIVGLEHSRGARCASQIFLDHNGNWYVHDRQNMSREPRRSESVGLGFALLRPAVVEAGLRFDPRYEMYYKQDDDFIFQMRYRLGLEAWVYPVGCIHHGRASIEANEYRVGEASNAQEFDSMKRRNQRVFAQKWVWALRRRRRTLQDEAAHLAEMEAVMAERRAES